jgi:hypothetical protein
MPQLIFLICICLFICIGGLISFYEKSKENKKKKKSNFYNGLGFLIIVIGAITAFAQGFYSEKSKESSENKIDSINNVITSKQTTIDSITKVLNGKEDSIVKIQNMNFDTARFILSQSLELNRLQRRNNKNQNFIIGLQNKNFDTVNSLLSQSLKLNELQEINNEKQQELSQDLTDSTNRPKLFCQAVLTTLEDTTYFIAIGLFNLGNYPIRDCYIKFQQAYEGYDLDPTPSYTLPPISTTYYYKSKIPFLKTGTYYQYRIEVRWDRGAYLADLKIKSTPEKDKHTLKTTFEFFTISRHPLPKNYFKW